ncbi:hypothetical protein [Massiliimalia timonensis]|uniref:hypothetical protein n=1 Tax=Massiliimalia timonensis TaxID=1987501 RepID=UPI0018A08774|nr:hypothetical protein [Massiliimalia timonensis]
MPYQIKISNTENSVLFLTDNKKEIEAMIQYFQDIWIIEKPKQTDTYLTKIKSKGINQEEYTKIIENLSFEYCTKLFYDMSSGYKYEDDNFYMVSKDLKLWLTIYNKINHNILFLRINKEIYNVHLSQMIKDPINAKSLLSGQLLLHSSAVSLFGKIILFPAQKAAGKSTLLMSLLNYSGNYLGNDSNFISVEDSSIICKKNPHCIRLGKETVQYNAILKEFFSNIDNQNIAKMLYANIIMNGKIQFVPSALAKIYSRNCIEKDGKKVSFIIFPTLDLTIDKNEIVQISSEEAKSKLEECIEDADHRICWLPFFEEKTLYEAVRQISNEIFKKIPISYKLKYSGDVNEAYETLKKVIY